MSALVAGRVTVPGSTSNLGAGFDCIGLAVDRMLVAAFRPGGERLELRRSGCLDRVEDPAEQDLLVQAFRRALRREGHETVAGVLDVDSAIPVGRGLGSSAAAVVAGTALAQVVSGFPVDPAAAFRAGFDEEGHGDNAAPCAFGGLRAVVGREPAVKVVRLALSPSVGFGFAAPSHSLSTRKAREVLPSTVPFGTATEAIWRTAALLRGLAEGDGELLALGFDDQLHAPHRLGLIPGSGDAIEAALAAGAWGVTVSGAGSGLLTVGPVETVTNQVAAAAKALEAHYGPGDVTAFVLRPAEKGVTAM